MLILHGLLQDRASMRPLADALEDHATVITMDLRGHGGSSAIHGVDLHLNDLVSDAYAVLDAAEVTGSVVLVGVELGAIIANLMQSELTERIAGTVLVNYPATALRDVDTLTDIATRAYREQTEQALNKWLDLSWGTGWQDSVPKPRIAAARRSAGAIHPVLTSIAAANLPDADSISLPGGTPFAEEADVATVMEQLVPMLD